MTESLVRKYCHEKKCNCANVILHTCRDLWNLNISDDRIHMIGNICTYYRHDDICSAHTACITIVYLMLARLENSEVVKLTSDITATLMYLFDEEFGGRRCSSIRLNHSQQDTGCLRVLIRIAEMMQELLCHIDTAGIQKNYFQITEGEGAK